MQTPLKNQKIIFEKYSTLEEKLMNDKLTKKQTRSLYEKQSNWRKKEEMNSLVEKPNKQTYWKANVEQKEAQTHRNKKNHP